MKMLTFLEQFIDVHKKWGDIEYWQALKEGLTLIILENI